MQNYQKRKDFLICVDSDGCAMDTMNTKHKQCFGPCVVAQWNLQKWENEVLTRWNEINLYTLTRGINRFKGLALILPEINERYIPVQGMPELLHWVNTAKDLSENSLAQEIQSAEKLQKNTIGLQNALNWSKSVNSSIDTMPEEQKLPFEYVKEGLSAAHEVADVVVVSSANRKAVLDEWGTHGLLDSVDLVMAQDNGSKAHCIASMLKHGYAPHRVLMIGDAPGDKAAADENGVWYYPILVRKENESWKEFCNKGLSIFMQEKYSEYAKKKNDEFLSVLGR